MRIGRLLPLGLLVSLAAHAAGSAYFSPGPDDVEIAASQGGAVSVIGSLEDLVAGTNAPLEPLEELPEDAQPIEDTFDERPIVQPPVEMASVQPVDAVASVHPDVVVPVVRGVTDMAPVTVDTLPEAMQPEVIETSDPVEELKPAQALEEFAAQLPPPTSEADVVPLAEAVKPAVKTVPAPPIETVERLQPIETLEAEAVEVTPTETFEVAMQIPAAKPEPPKRKKPPQKRKPQIKAKRGGEQDARRGGETVTSERGRSNANGRSDARSNDGGLGARSNYNGKVLAKLRRSKRYPAKARRDRMQGTVTVRFTVSQNGSVSGISVVRSSGQPVLDQAARDMVSRAAPMPKIPPEARRNRISFTVPVHFSR